MPHSTSRPLRLLSTLLDAPCCHLHALISALNLLNRWALLFYFMNCQNTSTMYCTMYYPWIIVSSKFYCLIRLWVGCMEFTTGTLYCFVIFEYSRMCSTVLFIDYGVRFTVLHIVFVFEYWYIQLTWRSLQV